ncbi:MAG: exodeoxyribonuclease VII small subunit [bacterium]
MAKKADNTPNFETAVKELEGLVKKMETGDLSLEESLKEYERGMELTRICQQALEQAELKVKVISEQYATKAQASDDND